MGISNILTRCIVLQQVMSIYDPLGLICPFPLKAKLLLRETWKLDLGWDENLPQEMRENWISFFNQLFQRETLRLRRHLTTDGVECDPWLILFSDGNNLAYGFVGYIMWRLQKGGYWCRLVMAKCRIVPLHKTTSPRMELNGTVLSKRGRQIYYKLSYCLFVCDRTPPKRRLQS